MAHSEHMRVEIYWKSVTTVGRCSGPQRCTQIMTLTLNSERHIIASVASHNVFKPKMDFIHSGNDDNGLKSISSFLYFQ